MAAARGNFLVFGSENASVRQIGERCGMTAAGIYRHCRDKAGRFKQAVELAVKLLPNWLAVTQPGMGTPCGGSPEEALRCLTNAEALFRHGWESGWHLTD